MNTPRTLILTAGALALSACGGGSGTSGDISGTGTSGTGSLSLAVTDAPVDNADAVVVTFTEVQLIAGENGDEASETFVLDSPRQIDLLQLQGSQSEFLIEGQTVPVGTYEQIRLIIDAPDTSCQNPSAPFASFITIDGTDFPLAVPSGAQSGFKFNGPITIATGNAVAYTIDFDLRQSIAERGATNCYNLRPVVRVVDNAEVGTLTGTVDGDLLMNSACTADTATGEGAAVYLFTGADAATDDVDGTDPEPLTTALLEPLDNGTGDFSYEIGFLLSGDYTAALTCQAGDDDPETDDAITFDPVVGGVSISADTVTTQDFSATPES